MSAVPMAGSRVLMIGTDPGGRGGVASVVATYRDAGLFENEGITYLCSHRDGSRATKATTAASSMVSLVGWLARGGARIVHVHAASRWSFMRKSLILWLARCCGARTVFHLHGAEFHRFVNDESGPLKRWWIRHTLERSSRVICLSRSWARYVASIAPAAHVEVVPNAVMIPRLPAKAQEKGRMLFVGRVEARKGVYVLVDAVAHLKRLGHDVTVAVAGDGELDALQAAAAAAGVSDRFEILGWLDPGQRLEQLARASGFVLPSFEEGLPMALLEAMAAGRAVVATPVGGIPEVATDGVNALLVPPGDEIALAGALQRLLADEPLRDALGRAAARSIAQAHDASTAAVRLRELYAGLENGR
jgi:glycosyltransferase involved in cell wall biosynthesis